LISDLKLNSQFQTHALHDVTKMINFAGYEFIHNSPTASRGVGVLISKKINHSVPVVLKDHTGNILVIKLIIDNVEFTVGSVYGPNNNDMGFFNELENLTCDPRGPNENLDVVNMANIPSRQRTLAMNRMSERLGLVDAFRTLNPTARECPQRGNEHK
jgi:exonuclease III